jgi:hypothetical protein
LVAADFELLGEARAYSRQVVELLGGDSQFIILFVVVTAVADLSSMTSS